MKVKKGGGWGESGEVGRGGGRVGGRVGGGVGEDRGMVGNGGDVGEG